MQSLFHFVAPPGQCGYLPEQTWRLEYEIAQSVTAAEYKQRMENGWRRFGRAMFRPRCQACQECRPIRVVVDQFRRDRSQQRAWRANDGTVSLQIGKPNLTREKLDLYDKYHRFQAQTKRWPEHSPGDAESYLNSYVDNPFPTQEWCYSIDSRLVGVAYVDNLPQALSGIYFFYDPAQRRRSLGTWNILCMLAEAAERGVPHLYLGYYVAGCQSMKYKAMFRPCELRGMDGGWRVMDGG